MSMSDGVKPMIDLTGMTTMDQLFDALLLAIPDPDTTSTSGSQQGVMGYLDEMAPFASAQLRVEIEALKTKANNTTIV